MREIVIRVITGIKEDRDNLAVLAAVAAGRVSLYPLSKEKNMRKKIVGQRTSKGVIIKKLSKHTCDRCGQRYVSATKLMEMIQHPEAVARDKKHADKGNKFHYKKGRFIAVVDHDNGEIVTIYKH